MTRKNTRQAAWGSTSTPSRRPGAAHDSRSASPRSRGRLTPPLPDTSSRPADYPPALLGAFTRCIGASVCIQTKKGERFEGILHTPGLEQSIVHFVLRKARKLKQDGAETNLIEKLVIPSTEVVQMFVEDVVLQPDPPRPTTGPVISFHLEPEAPQYTFGNFDDIGFLGDKDRERAGAGLFGRELEKWEPDEGLGVVELDDNEHEVGTWDQFAANERKFGVKTDFNMDLYTTRLEPEKSRYTVEQASKIARDIQSASSPNLHLQDDRGLLTLDDSGITEEMLYSSVMTATVVKDEKLTVETPEKSEQSEKGALTQDDKSSSSKSPEPRKISLILPTQGTTRPMIINKHKPEARGEYLKVVRDLSKLRPDVHGSPLQLSPLVNDHKQLQALDLTPGASNRKIIDQENREKFRKYKHEAKGMAKGAKTREEIKATWLRFKEDTERIPLAKTPKAAESPSQKDIPRTHGFEMDGGFGSQMLDEETTMVHEGSRDGSAATSILVRDLPHVKTAVESGEDDELHDSNSGRGGLNPHATPFNPDGTTVDPSPRESPATVPVESPAVKSSKKVSMSDSDEFPPLQSQPTTVELAPPPIAQPVLIRPPPPPPPPQSHQQTPPRVVTPPPPAHMTETEHHPQAPMVMPMPMPMSHRMQQSKQGSSPAGHRTPISNVHPDPPPSMIINQPTGPHIMMTGPPQNGPPQTASGPPLLSNGPPPQMISPMIPHMSGAMHVMPQQMGPYPYGPEMRARMPMIYQYPSHMPPVAGPPAPPGTQTPSNGEQQMQPQHPMIYAPYYPGMPVPYHYGASLIPHGMQPHFIPVPPAPMTAQRPANGPAQRPRPRRKAGGTSFLYARRG